MQRYFPNQSKAGSSRKWSKMSAQIAPWVGRLSVAAAPAIRTLGGHRLRRGLRYEAFCDAQADAARRFHGEYGGEYYTTDPERIFSDPAVKIVSIATSHGSHAELALAVLGAKKHLFLEKPMAMTTADCLRIYETMKVAGRKLMLDFTIRFSGAARAIKHRLRCLKGEPRSMYGSQRRSQPMAVGFQRRWRPAF